MTPIYDAGPQVRKVRALLWCSLVSAVAGVWAGIDLARSYGLSPAEGGVLAPLPVRLAWGVGIGAIGVGFLVGMRVYVECYVARAEVDGAGTRLHLTLVRFFGRSTLVVPVEAVLGGRHHHGRADHGGVRVNAPWDTVQIAGRRLPLVVDAQGDVLDRERASRFLGI